MHPELNLLPKFRILRVISGESPQYEGVFDVEMGIKDGWVCYLITSNGKMVYGRCYAFNPINRTATFKPDSLEVPIAIESDAICWYIDGYWGWHAELVLDKSMSWSRVEFQPSDAVEWRNEHGLRTWAKTGGSHDGKIMKDGWDHEHCEMCMEKISTHHQKFGYVDENNHWLCEECYLTYVQPCSLAFITEHAVSQIRHLK